MKGIWLIWLRLSSQMSTMLWINQILPVKQTFFGIDGNVLHFEKSGFLAKFYKITKELRLKPTSMCPTSPMPTTSWSSAVATERSQACLKLLTNTLPQLACELMPRKPRWCQPTSLWVAPSRLAWLWALGACWKIQVPRLDIRRTEEIRSRFHPARSAFSRLQSCLWSRREI